MAVKHENVIVFGATGETGRYVAQEAAKRGATVWLAMRDISKPIPDLDEKQGRFHRVNADLTDNASLKAAVEQSKATAAFFYRVQTQDALESAAQTVKDAGVTNLVFLSSITIPPGARLQDLPRTEFIPYMHLEIEDKLNKVAFETAAYLRPGYFASNPFKFFIDQSKQPWEANVPKSEGLVEPIALVDIGRVGGAELVTPSPGTKNIYLRGPDAMSDKELFAIIEKECGVKIDLHELDEEAFVKYGVARGMSEAFARHQSRGFADRQKVFEAAIDGDINVRKYSGYEPTSFSEYLRSSKSLFMK